MLLQAARQFFADPANISIIVIGWALSALLFIYWREKKKVWIAYAHIFFLITPLFYFAIGVPCQVPFVQGLMQFCSLVITKAIIYLIPFLLSAAILIGYFIIPKFYQRAYKAKPFTNKTIEKIAKSHDVKVKLLLIDSAEPIAFSTQNKIFVSVGMHDLLGKKQLESVLLHELGHVVNKSTNSKISTMLMRLVSPLARFTTCNTVDEEEHKADAFAVEIQGTTEHLKQAKNTVEQFFSF